MGAGKEMRRGEKKRESRKVREDRLENKNILTHLSLDKEDEKPFYQQKSKILQTNN